MTAKSTALRAHGVRHKLGGRSILNGIDLVVESGTSLAITGPSGSGKTTLLLALAGLVIPDKGAIQIGDKAINRLKPAARAATRLNSIGVVYQFGELLTELTPLENVALPALLAGRGRHWAYQRAEQLLADLGVGSVAGRKVGVLSGGERQRVAVARALVTEPVLVLADEPTGALDRSSTETVAKLLYDLPSKYGCAVVVVTHNDRVAAGADRWLELDAGKLLEVDR